MPNQYNVAHDVTWEGKTGHFDMTCPLCGGNVWDEVKFEWGSSPRVTQLTANAIMMKHISENHKLVSIPIGYYDRLHYARGVDGEMHFAVIGTEFDQDRDAYDELQLADDKWIQSYRESITEVIKENQAALLAIEEYFNDKAKRKGRPSQADSPV